jgi:hypothetical protein
VFLSKNIAGTGAGGRLPPRRHRSVPREGINRASSLSSRFVPDLDDGEALGVEEKEPRRRGEETGGAGGGRRGRFAL